MPIDDDTLNAEVVRRAFLASNNRRKCSSRVMFRGGLRKLGPRCRQGRKRVHSYGFSFGNDCQIPEMFWGFNLASEYFFDNFYD